ncbi:cytosolic carboxypeptidase 6-like [Ursus arctos]|uniref:cytosolic carboxypeptidase 6-like n=1 Tax=Ursus arctos TaxID=9644 RepID=UPI002547A2FB|nr:cytosolic carboxypeptidase 6-like [Ursus arctos]
MIDFRCISVEDLRYPAPRPGPGTSGVDALGSQETRLKRPPPSTKRQPQESQPIQVCGQPKDPLGSRTRWFGGGERRGGVPAPQAPRPKSAGEPRGRGLGRTLPPSPPPSPHFPPRAACRHAGRPLPWQPSRRVCLRELCQPADPVARSPLPRDFRVGLEAEGQQKMAERSQTAPEAGNDMGNDDAIGGNVSKYMVLPSGYCGQPKKGHLIFDACFESGNLGRVDQVSEFEYDLFIRPDTCNPRFRVWFNFTVENVKESQRVIFNIVNFSKTKSLYRDGMAPMVKSTSRPKWQRLPPKNVYYYRCPDHRKNYVMSFAFCFDREEDIYQFAYCYPYTYTRFQHYLDSLQKRNMDYFFREQLGQSVQQRQLDLLTITSPGE